MPIPALLFQLRCDSSPPNDALCGYSMYLGKLFSRACICEAACGQDDLSTLLRCMCFLVAHKEAV